jgi:peptidoglycan DL-endopeptidase CwlO
MRFGCPLLLTLVPLSFPAVGFAEQAPLTDPAAAEAPTAAKPAEARPPVVRVALRYLGTPYRWAGAGPAGFDCSGFVMYVYGKVGVRLPHSSTMLWGQGHRVTRSHLEPGDIVFFNGLTHVGIYIAHGRFVHSPHTGDVVKISRLSESWYWSTYDGARRPRMPHSRPRPRRAYHRPAELGVL